MTDDLDPIIVASDDGEILDDTEVACPNGHEFERDEALAATFDGDTAMYRCPECGTWTDGPRPG